MAPSNAELIAGNVRAMRKAIAVPTGQLNAEAICDMHDTLMLNTSEKQGLREEQVWIGGTPYSPHGAMFVPPTTAACASWWTTRWPSPSATT